MGRASAFGSQAQEITVSRRRNPRAQAFIVHRPTTETKVTLEHSKQLVRVAITATISTIVWIRRCFGPNYRWTYRSCDPADPTFTYATYKDCPKPTADFDPTPGLYQWPIIISGQQKAADKLLSWLEGDVRDAVEKGFLSKLQLNFHTLDGAISPSNVVESYTMAFTCGNEGITPLISTEFSGRREKNASMVTHDSNTQMINLVNSVCERVRCFDKGRNSSSKPPGRRLAMKLEFNDKCPADYQPDSFCISKDQAAINNTDVDRGVLTMKSDFHRVLVYVPSCDLDKDQADRARLSSSPKEPGEGVLEATQTPCKISNNSSKLKTPGSYDASHNVDMPFTQPEEVHTQPEVIMMLGNIGASRVSNNGTQDTVLLSKRRILYDEEASAAAPIIPSYQGVSARRYADHIYEKLDKARAQKIDASDCDLNEPPSTQPMVTCGCGVTTDEANLMQCGLCGSFQHMQCYGYYEPKPVEVESVCYNCLLRDEETVYSEMNTLCIRRRVIHYLLAVGGNTVENITGHLDCEVQDADSFLQTLGREGYLQQKRPKKKCTPKQRLARTEYIVVADEVRLCRELFDPGLGIAHHLKFSDTFVEEQLATSLGPFTEPSTQYPGGTGPSQSTSWTRENVLPEGSSTQGTPSPRILKPFPKNTTISRSHSPEVHRQLFAPEQTPSTGRKRDAEVVLSGRRKLVRFWDARSPQVVHPRA